MEYNFDIDEIKRQVERVIQYSQGFNVPLNGIDTMIDDWLQAKKDFIERMDGNLIYTLDDPVSFELDSNAKREKLERFSEQVAEHYENWELYQFLNSLNVEDFYNNRTSKDYTTSSGTLIPSNFKVVKAFKFFEKDPDRLKIVQSEASRIIQENVVSGYFCVSVHPLDFLSASENVHNWRSCHALDGEYRSGNLNYMMDNSTFMCYLRADKQAILPHFPEDVPWNSKKWRTLFFLSNDRTLLFAGRSYPFAAESGIELVRKEIMPRLGFGTWTKWHDTLVSSVQDERSGEYFYFSKMMPVGNTLKRLDRVVQNGHNTYQYNDLLKSTVYRRLWSYRKRERYWNGESTGGSNENTTVTLGAPCICPICGQNEISYSEIMACANCANEYDCDNDDYYECEICGSMTYCDDMYDLEYSGIRVCPNCYATETKQCQECGVMDLPEQVKYHQGDSRCLCPDCWEYSQREKKRLSSIKNIPIYF